MSTRSIIAEKLADGTFRAIYCHFDGYPDHHGPILLGHYSDPARVSALIDLGDISVLGERITPSGPHSYDQREAKVVVAYHRDRGEDLNPPAIVASLREIAADAGAGHIYSFEGGRWLHNGRPLSEVVASLGEVQP